MIYRDMICDGGGGPGPSSSVAHLITENMSERTKELLRSPIKEMQELGKILKEEEDLKLKMGIKTIRKIQEKYPEVILTGSVALYLHGVRLSRFKSRSYAGDIDLISPHYIQFESEDIYGGLHFEQFVQKEDYNEYDYTMSVIYEHYRHNADFRIDNKQAYEYIIMDDFKFKVSVMEDIIAAKIRFMKAGRGPGKHKDDLYEIFGKLTIVPEKEVKETSWSGS